MQNPLEVPIAQMQAALTKLQPQIIRKMGALAIEFTRENFAKQGFQGDSFEVWPQRKKTTKKDTGRLVLIKTAHLLNATRVVMYTGDSVTIGNCNRNEQKRYIQEILRRDTIIGRWQNA